MSRTFVLALISLSLTACATSGFQVPDGRLAPGAEFTVEISEGWAYRSPSSDQALLGGSATRDGMRLNRVHFVTLDDGDSLIRAARDVERPFYSTGSSELEIVELVTNSLTSIGYTTMEADSIRPTTIDGHSGIEFGLSGKWENGLNIKGDAAAIPVGDQLHLVVFLAPELHYYDALHSSVGDIIQSMDLPGSPPVG
jgi:hypothetical protein